MMKAYLNFLFMKMSKLKDSSVLLLYDFYIYVSFCKKYLIGLLIFINIKNFTCSSCSNFTTKNPIKVSIDFIPYVTYINI